MKLAVLKSTRWTFGIGSLTTIVCGGVLTAALYASGTSPQPEKKVTGASPVSTPTSISTGTGKQYKTTVDRKTEGELSAEDFRQASLLASRIMLHVNKAALCLGGEKNDQARKELERAAALVGIVRRLLPTTTVTTIIRDSNGKEVYRYVDRVQEDTIPLHEGLIAVNMMEPITDAKQGEAAVHGVRLADAELVHTSVLVKLDYVESKLNRALKLLKDKPEDALAQLAMAQSQGVDYVVNKQDNPLVKAQMALQVAERMSEEGREEAAKANLQVAKNYLEVYRGLLPTDKSEHVSKLEGEITKLQGEIGRSGAPSSIRRFWDRVASWFVRRPGEMRSTGTESATKTGESAATATASKEAAEESR